MRTLDLKCLWQVSKNTFVKFVEAVFRNLLKRREQENTRAAFLRGWSSIDVTLGDFPRG